MVGTAQARLCPPYGDFVVTLRRGCYQLVRRSLGMTLFKGGNGRLEIVAPLDQRPRQDRIPDVGSVGNPGARSSAISDSISSTVRTRSASILPITAASLAALSRLVSKRACIFICLLPMSWFGTFRAWIPNS